MLASFSFFGQRAARLYLRAEVFRLFFVFNFFSFGQRAARLYLRAEVCRFFPASPRLGLATGRCQATVEEEGEREREREKIIDNQQMTQGW